MNMYFLFLRTAMVVMILFGAPPGAMTPGLVNMYVLSLGTDTVI